MEVEFALPAVDEFCSSLRKLVTDHGGPEKFFASLSDDYQILTNIGIEHVRTLSRLFNDAGFREKFSQQISQEEDRHFLKGFLKGWNIWSDISPDNSQIVELTLIRPSDVLNYTPTTANDPQQCTSLIYLDSYTETFRVKSILRLTWPNKELGGTDVFIIASSLQRFLGTIRIMLASIILRESEMRLFKIPNDQEIIPEALDALTKIRELTDNLQKQFERMR